MNKLFETNYDNSKRQFNNIRNVNLPKENYRDIIVRFNTAEDMNLFMSKLNISFSKTDLEYWYKPIGKQKTSALFDTKRITIKFEPKTNSVWEEYCGMPEYITTDSYGYHKILVHFNCKEDVDDFCTKLDYSITDKTRSIWFPKQPVNSELDYVYHTTEDVQPHFPIYVISKGRWDTSYTVKNLKWMNIKTYFVIVEEEEYKNYAKYIEKEHLLILDKKFQKEYQTLDADGDALGLPVGSGAARNFAWEHSIKLGYERHWIMDDNIYGFYRLNKNRPYRVQSGAFFRAMEDFVCRYENVVMAGPQYKMFIPSKDYRYPLQWNCRIYSCNLIKNDIPFRWRCRYNEDTDLSLNILKAGYSTLLFVPFLQDKAVTQSVKGGNTGTIYTVGTKLKSEALARLHPDVTEVVYKYNRVHHYVNYSKFKNNKPILKENITIPEDGTNEYSMQLDFTGDTVNQCHNPWPEDL